jgi:hypothetical protein
MEETLVITPTVAKLRDRKAERRQQAYFPPVSQAVAVELYGLHPAAPLVWMELQRRRAMGWSEPFTLGADFALPAWTKNRALAALEKAGRVRVERRRGWLPRIWLIG